MRLRSLNRQPHYLNTLTGRKKRTDRPGSQNHQPTSAGYVKSGNTRTMDDSAAEKNPAKKRQTTKRDYTEARVESLKKLKKDATGTKTPFGGQQFEAQFNAIASTNRQPHTQGQDLESALNFIGEQKDEMLPDRSYLSFRLGHAGDASKLASWYRDKTSKPKISQTSQDNAKDRDNKSAPSNAPKTEENSKEAPASSSSSSLEIWLADALGNEDIPPSLFALLAHVKSVEGKKANKLAAVALMTLAWDSARVLRVEWFQVESEIDNCRFIERRMWLRLAALGLMTSCELHVVEQPSWEG